MTLQPPISRHLAPRLVEALDDTPVVLVHGPRQCGKTTLARDVGGAAGMAYVSFDDDVQRASAEADPAGFVRALPARVVLDEVQRVPRLFTALKAAVDADRRPGRFLLTGSANVLLVPTLADSLAGRLEVLRLHPFAQVELAATSASFLDVLFSVAPEVATIVGVDEGADGDLIPRVVAGGFPPALARRSPRRRATWYRDYVNAIVQRDVRDLARIHSLDVLPTLLANAAAQTARLFNMSELAGSLRQTLPTIRAYLTLLEQVFLIERLPPWHTNRLSRLVKTPKLHVADTGVACALLGVDADGLGNDRALYGQLLESFVYGELRRMTSAHESRFAFFHYRDKDGAEVDIVLEGENGRIAGVEVKAAATVTRRDFVGLERLREAADERFVGGVVLYDGTATLPFGDRLRAMPLAALWQP